MDSPFNKVNGCGVLRDPWDGGLRIFYPLKSRGDIPGKISRLTGKGFLQRLSFGGCVHLLRYYPQFEDQLLCRRPAGPSSGPSDFLAAAIV